MKNNKYIFLLIILIVVISRNSLVNLINNTLKSFFIKDNNIEINYLNSEINRLKNEYNNLLDFKNNININEDYYISNVYKNNYSFIYCNEEQIRSYVDKMIDSKMHLKIYNENEINLIKSRWNRTISIFNENLSLANYSVILGNIQK